ncbi:hypothetical protein [Streptomyces sp. B6B3]|uniref:hypothetical protein n=1 Tax=Streptomyces sp. B6B3 TaxID=3153570 RepID=UPI00325EE3B9
MTEWLPLAKELDEYSVTPGVLGFIVFAVLGVGVWMLLKSMSRHLGKIAFDEEPDGREDQDGREAGKGPAAAESEQSSSRASA